jgi:hypothetical protein
LRRRGWEVVVEVSKEGEEDAMLDCGGRGEEGNAVRVWIVEADVDMRGKEGRI